MDFFMNFSGIVFLAFLASGFYLTLLKELHKASKGIPVECESVEEICEILTEKLKCSFLKEIRINEKQMIEFQCKYDIHTGILEDGKFYIDKLVRKFSSHREVEEAWYLQKYVEGVFSSEHVEGEVLERRFAKYIKIFNVSRVIKYAVYVCIAILIFSRIGGMDAIKSKGVSQMCFTDYSDEITIGEALKATCTKGKWSNSKIRDDLYHVTYSGYGANGSLLTILFQTDGSSCSIKSITLGDDDVTLMQGLLLEMIYENAQGGDTRDQEPKLLEDDLTTDDMEVIGKDRVDLSEQPNETSDDLETDQAADDEAYDSEVQGAMDDSISVWELSGYYGGITDGQSVMDISMYTEDTENGSIGYADIYVEGGEYSYQAELYEASTNLYWVAADTDEEVALFAYRDGADIIVQLYVDGECITEYLLMGQFQS